MFKKLLEGIIEADTFDEAFNPVDMAYQQEKISWRDHQTLWRLCCKMFDS